MKKQIDTTTSFKLYHALDTRTGKEVIVCIDNTGAASLWEFTELEFMNLSLFVDLHRNHTMCHMTESNARLRCKNFKPMEY